MISRGTLSPPATVCVMTNSTASRLCTKRPQLVKTEANNSVYWLDFGWKATGHAEIMSRTLHRLDSCEACGDNLRQRMGVVVVPDSFVAERTVSARVFSCAMLPTARVLRATRTAAGPMATMFFFQPRASELLVHNITDCNACPGAPCITAINVSSTYAATLNVSAQTFSCSLASGYPPAERGGLVI